ncbi:hypothetical protein GOACH_04_03160 [Gordonia aichiensis NBRC 108223]|uniref:Uncharacterized protein n=1 Tax=Gordonia aichiensis NBRC 108223 TaxID=1220583 RepID=L7KH23_9ACTN|nr:hypothetical protein GOACH_04_03160 [Gordonia aichiensis NBRC 108223]
MAPEVQTTTKTAPNTIDSHRWVTMREVVIGLRRRFRLAVFLRTAGLVVGTSGSASTRGELSVSGVSVAGLSDSRISVVGDSSAASVVSGVPLSISEG